MLARLADAEVSGVIPNFDTWFTFCYVLVGAGVAAGEMDVHPKVFSYFSYPIRDFATETVRLICFVLVE